MHRALALAAVLAALAQAPPKAPADTAGRRLEAIENRLAVLEQRVAALPAAALDTRLDRLDARLSRLEERALQTRSGEAPPGSFQILESRVQALEREVARLRR